MLFLLDTNVISSLMREDARAVSWLSSIQPDDRLAVCPIVLGEIWFGIGRLPPGRRRDLLSEKARRLLRTLPCEPVPPAAGDRYAIVKIAQQRLGLPLDENDLWIAATALAIGATLVSSDGDFRRIEALGVAVP